MANASKEAMRVTAARWKPVGLADDLDFAGGATSLDDMVMGFFDEEEGLSDSCSSGSGSGSGAGDEEDDDEQNAETLAERKEFWNSQHRLVKGVLCRSSSVELRIRNDTEQALKDSRAVGPICFCPKPVTGGCRSCLLRDVSDRLRDAGYDSAICRSKWQKSPDIPSGEHSYIDVVATSSSKKTGVRVVIELDFRAEFEMARASPEYNGLIDCLPLVFVGKVERLSSLIKILCGAAKKCMKENKMHMGPWRKHKYMQAKWLGSYERRTAESLFSIGLPDRQPKPRASMLTFDLLDKLPGLHCTAVEVV